MAAPTIPNGKSQFFTTLYEGNGGGQRVGKFVPFTDNGTIANSVIYNRSDNPYMSFDKSSITPDSDKKFTFSCWFKLGELGSRLNTGIFNSNSGGEAGGNVTRYAPLLTFTANGNIFGYDYDSGGYNWYFSTNRTFEDTSKWYHFVLAIDTTQSTSTDRMKVYIDGNQITSFSSSTYPALNQDLYTVMAGGYHILGLGYNVKFDGYLAEVNLIENQQLTPSTFGVTDTSTGRWIPKALTGITYGTNGFRLKFQQSNALGDDTSGNGNDFTSSNLTTTDQTTDSPTQNHNTFASFYSGTSASDGNLIVSTGTTNGYAQCVAQAGFGIATGKWYWEVKVTTVGAGIYGWKDDGNAGGSQASNSGTIGSGGNFSGGLSTGGSGGFSGGSWYIDHDYNNEVNYTTVSTNDVLMFAMDLDTGKGYCGKNGTWFNSANPANGTGAIGGCHRANGINKFYPCAVRLDSASVGEFNFGQKSFAHTAPTGFSALQQDNLPETAKGVTGLTWIKDRDNGSYYHTLVDSSRGANKEIYTNDTSVEASTNDSVTKFLKGGVAVEDAVNVNNSGDSFVSYNWVGNSGTTATNDASSTGIGTIDSTYQVNSDAGFSIVQYTGTGSAGTIKHGLSVAPSLMLVKNLSANDAWKVYHHKVASDPQTDYLVLNTTAAPVDDATVWNDTAPTSSVFSIGTHTDVNTNTENYVAYCWAEVEGFSKFGVYKGNGAADGPFVYTGFKPAWIVFKANNTTNWYMHDATRNPFNPVLALLDVNAAAADNSGYVSTGVDFVSNGFKVRQPTGYGYNYDGTDIYYLAFGSHPFVGDGTNPVTAR